MADTSALNEKYKAFVADNTENINKMYDANQTSQLSGLESAYNTNLSNMEAQKADIDKQYNTAANDLGVQYERNRYNNNLQAANNGLNVGAGSQMALSQAGQYQRDFGALRGAQAAAQVEQDRQINNVKAEYQLAVQKAIADNDLARAAALVDEANNQIGQLTNAYNLQQQDLGNAAALLAAGGDYSGYASLFGFTKDQANMLKAQWAVANPDAAVYSGVISPEKYEQITGQKARGFDTGAGGGSGNFNSSYYATQLGERNALNNRIAEWNKAHPKQTLPYVTAKDAVQNHGATKGWGSKVDLAAAAAAKYPQK